MTKMEQVNARNIVLKMLLKVKDEPSHVLLKNTLDSLSIDQTQKSFITRLFKGVLEKQIELDYIIDCFSKTKTKKMKPTILAILRLSVYQIKFMDSVPDSAVCNEAVKLCKKHKYMGLSGFVNGVLRTIAREIDNVNYPTEYPLNLSVKYSIPMWILEMWDEQYGRDKTIEIADGFESEKGIFVRVNTSLVSTEDVIKNLEYNNVSVTVNDVNPDVLLLSNVGNITTQPTFAAGMVTVQNLSSTLVGLEADPGADDYVIDICAAPGGKSIHIADMMLAKSKDAKGVVEARDVSDDKIKLIEENIARTRFKNVKTKVADGTVLDESSINKADIVICDVPCSGLGVIANKSDIKYNTSMKGIKDLVLLQKQIISNAVKYVKPGGKLIFSTCTINKMENDQNAKWIEEELGLNLLNSIQIFPHDNMDGFYIAAFRKEENE